MTEPIEARLRRSVRGREAWRTRWSRRSVLALFRSLHAGEIILHEQGHVESFGNVTEDCPLSVDVYMHDGQAYERILFGGSIGAGEAYMAGLWSCSDLTALMRIMSRNLSLLSKMEVGWARVSAPARRLLGFLRRNTPGGSKKNIAAHYDLSNAFFALFLDETMTYSAGIFENDGDSMADASWAKLDRMCRKLHLQPDDHVLEIGTGWGSFALHAARHYGCRVTTTTISREQHAWASERVSEAGLGDRITLLRQDYRELTGVFDKIASIEMIEAVGPRFLPGFFERCAALLKPDGLMALQAITVWDREWPYTRNSTDFISRYIFPGGCLVSVMALCEAMAKRSDLQVVHLEDITPHYAETLRHWREKFHANLDRVKSLGFDDVFIRMWDYYLSYCEGGFQERVIGDVQMVLAKPMDRRTPLLGTLTSGA